MWLASSPLTTSNNQNRSENRGYRRRRFQRAPTFLSGKWLRSILKHRVIRLQRRSTSRVTEEKLRLGSGGLAATLASLSVPSHDGEPLPPSSGADYYVNGPEERMKRWAEEDKGGQTKPGLHKHRKHRCCVGSASSSLQRLSTAHSFLFIKGP